MHKLLLVLGLILPLVSQADPAIKTILLGSGNINDYVIDAGGRPVLGKSLTGAALLPGSANPGAHLYTGSGSDLTSQLPYNDYALGGALLVGSAQQVHFAPAGSSAIGGSGLYYVDWANISLVPEPSTYATLLLGLAVLGCMRRKRG